MFTGIEYDDFITLQPQHIKEAIPELVPRIKFENLFKKFLTDNTHSILEKNRYSVIVEDPLTHSMNEITDFEYNTPSDPTFDEAALLVTATPVVTDTSMISHILTPTSPGDIKSVQV